MGSAVSDLEALTADFFDTPNEIDVISLEGEPRELIQALLDRLVDDRRTLLPARVNGGTRWYGLARSELDARLLVEELASWLGPPLCDEAVFVDTPEDVLDERAARLAGSGTPIRVRVGDGWQRRVRENVQCLVAMWALTPQRSYARPRPVGRVLRLFYEGIAARDRALAAEALDEIRVGGMLSAANIRFLRVELLGLLGSPEELRNDPLLTDIALLRRPPAVTDHLARAADALYVPPNATESGPDTWRLIATKIDQAWPRLIAHPSQVRSVHGARCLALSELLAERPRLDVAASLKSNWGEDALVAAVVAVLESAPETPVVDFDTSDAGLVVLSHYRLGEFEAVLDSAERIELEGGIAAVVMHAALNLGDAEAATRALTMIDQISDADREALLSQQVASVFYTQLLERNQGKQIPAGWIDWLRNDWPDRPDLLRDWSAGWSRDDLADSAVVNGIAEELLDALHDGRRGRVRNGLPALVHWLVAEDGLRPSSVPLAVTILDIMLGSEPGRPERNAALDLLGEVLLTGCSPDEYSTAIAALRDQLGRIGPREVDWLTGTLDVLLLNAVPNAQLRDKFFAEVLGVALSWYERIQRSDALLLTKLFADVGLEFDPPLSDQTEAPAPQELRTLERVVIYSLSESAAQNAARWIRDEWPNAKVQLSHAHANSEELENLVSASDVVLVQTSHAKHAATAAIEHLVDAKRLVRVNGRGATSLFRCLLEWVTAVG